jgi:hypothetical protein
MERFNRIFQFAGTPSAGTSEVQTITLNAFGACTVQVYFRGSFFIITFTGAEANGAIDTAVQAKMDALRTVGTGNSVVSTSGTTNRVIQVTFQGILAKKDLPQFTATVTTGTPTVALATTTPGVTATGLSPDDDLQANDVVVDTTNKKMYMNTGTSTVPVWTVVGAQT